MKFNQLKTVLIGLFIILISVPAFAQNSDVVEEIKDLSQQKWVWMTADQG